MVTSYMNCIAKISFELGREVNHNSKTVLYRSGV